MCEAFGVDVACLPQVTDSDGLFGTTDLGGFLPAPVSVHGVLGDSHAALFAQGCHSRGMAKATYGTGQLGHDERWNRSSSPTRTAF